MLKTIGALAKQYDVRALLPWPVAASMGLLPAYPRLLVRLLVVHPLIIWHLIWHRPRLIHLFMPELLPIALLFRLLGGQVVYEVQENHRLKFDRKPRNRHPIFQTLFDQFDRLVRRYFYFVFTEDSYLTEYHSLALPCAVVHNFPEKTAGRPRSPKRDVVSADSSTIDLCYLGLITNDRGLDTMLAVLNKLENSRLHLFGRMADDCLDELTAFGDRVRWYGHVSQAVAFPIMRQCVAGLALLKPVGDYPDSYPTKLFEYMALGLPVITSNFPLYRSVLENHQCGFCVDPTDVVSLVAHITWLVEHPGEAESLGENGFESVQVYHNWETEANKLLELYQNIDFK
ncbi:MAG: glycosyltransferase [Rudanella sp.]|nr:glycosyltransferase [Rudanella sp.]